VAYLIPVADALDEVLLALAEAGAAGRGAHRISRLTREQRLVARDQIDRQQPLSEVAPKRLGRELQACSPRRARRPGSASASQMSTDPDIDPVWHDAQNERMRCGGRRRAG